MLIITRQEGGAAMPSKMRSAMPDKFSGDCHMSRNTSATGHASPFRKVRIEREEDDGYG